MGGFWSYGAQEKTETLRVFMDSAVPPGHSGLPRMGHADGRMAEGEREGNWEQEKGCRSLYFRAWNTDPPPKVRTMKTQVEIYICAFSTSQKMVQKRHIY